MKQFVKLQMSDLQKVVTFYNTIIDDSKESPYSPVGLKIFILIKNYFHN